MKVYDPERNARGNYVSVEERMKLHTHPMTFVGAPDVSGPDVMTRATVLGWFVAERGHFQERGHPNSGPLL